MRILFHVEPVIFRNEPFFLQPWLSWIGQMIQAHVAFDTKGQFAFSSSPWLCRAMQLEISADLTLFPVAPASILHPFGMDRVSYGQDLAKPKTAKPQNTPLIEHISVAIDKFKPDVIISFTQPAV